MPPRRKRSSGVRSAATLGSPFAFPGLISVEVPDALSARQVECAVAVEGEIDAIHHQWLFAVGTFGGPVGIVAQFRAEDVNIPRNDFDESPHRRREMAGVQGGQRSVADFGFCVEDGEQGRQLSGGLLGQAEVESGHCSPPDHPSNQLRY